MESIIANKLIELQDREKVRDVPLNTPVRIVLPFKDQRSAEDSSPILERNQQWATPNDFKQVNYWWDQSEKNQDTSLWSTMRRLRV